MNFRIGEKVRIVETADKKLLGQECIVVNLQDKMVAVSYERPDGTGYEPSEWIWVGYNQIEHVAVPQSADTVNYTPYEMRFFALTEEMRNTFIKKNRDYGSSFSDTIDKFGVKVAVARIHDKYMRVENLVLGQEMMVQESMRDTLMDMANYCLLTVMALDREKKNEQ